MLQLDAIGSEAFDNAHAAAWAWANNSPFKGAKSAASDLGGIRLPVVISWPNHISRAGEVCSEFIHLTDIAPTLFEIAGIEMPREVYGNEQMPLEGKSFVHTFQQGDNKSKPRTQYFEAFGTRGIYKDGWWAGSPKGSVWGQSSTPIPPADQRPWELYNIAQDYSQSTELSKQNPGKLQELITIFDEEAKRNNLYPLDLDYFTAQPSLKSGKIHFSYQEGNNRIPIEAAPSLAGKAHKITAEFLIPASGAEGVIAAQGGRHGGFTLYVRNNRLVYETSAFGQLSGTLESSSKLTPGNVYVEIEITTVPNNEVPRGFRRSFLMKARLIVNGKVEGEAENPAETCEMPHSRLARVLADEEGEIERPDERERPVQRSAQAVQRRAVGPAEPALSRGEPLEPRVRGSDRELAARRHQPRQSPEASAGVGQAIDQVRQQHGVAAQAGVGRLGVPHHEADPAGIDPRRRPRDERGGAVGWFDRQRGTAVAVIVAALTAGQAFPHLVAALAGNLPWRTQLLVPVALASAGGLVALFLIREGPFATEADRFDPRAAARLFTNRFTRLAALGYLGHMWELYAMWAWIGAFVTASLEASGTTSSHSAASLASFVGIATGSIGCLIAGMAGDRVGRARVAGVALTTSGLAAAASALAFGGPAPLVFVLVAVWGLAVVADSAQFSAIVADHSGAYVGTALTIQTSAGYLLTMASIRLVAEVGATAGWRWAFLVLVPGPLVGTWAMRRLRRRLAAISISPRPA